ncbi:MAG: four helix bundle protein [Pedobacter sp.]
MKHHKQLDVWKRSVTLAGEIYSLTRVFPPEEKYGLTSQMRRAGVSIASNIAEGAARQTKKEFIQFLHIASGSASELDTQIEIAKLINIGKQEKLLGLQQDISQISKMLKGLIRSLGKPQK